MTKAWIVIPARGGSRGVPRKNLRMVLGKPLIAYTIQTALEVIPSNQVIVVTDDDEIEEVSLAFGAKVIREAKGATGLATLDQVMVKVVPDLIESGAEEHDLLLTMQPTCPLVSSNTITEAISRFKSGAGSVITVKDDRHLTWTVENGKPKKLYKDRVNRQLLPPQFRESGAIIGARISDVLKFQTRIVEPIALIELPESESLDIDTFADLVVAEHWLSRKRVILHADAAPELGMGHVYRTLALAQELARHDLLILTTKSKPLGAEFFAQQVFEHREIENQEDLISLAQGADLVVLDILDTEANLVQKLQLGGSKVVTFEDLGSGAEVADLTVSDLYPNPRAKRQLSGVESSILAPSFETLPRRAEVSIEVNHILVLFGGTDPAGLAEKSLAALERIGFAGKVTCIRGLGAKDIEGDYTIDLELKRNVKNIGSVMATADLALSSAGRTITELMSIGVPTICLAQNQKELSHTHAIAENGILNLGLGAAVTEEQLAESITDLISQHPKRFEMNQKALAATRKRTNAKVVSKLLDLIEI